MCNFYRSLISFGTYLQPVFLLLLRLFWGAILIEVGLLKFLNITSIITSFENLGIFFPSFSAYMVAGFELICGVLLLFGFLSRLAAVPLIVIMIVAYATAHAEALKTMPQNILVFSEQAPFPFLLLGLIIFCFGPGKYSIDGLIAKKKCTKHMTDKDIHE